MKFLFARLAASGAISGAIVASFGTPALADNFRCGFTGPNSRNIITSDNANRFNQNVNNTVRIDNRNDQRAASGNVLVAGNTLVGNVEGSGNAINSNRVSNNVNITDPRFQTRFGPGFNERNNAFIRNTGPRSNNEIRFKNSNRVNQNINNTVGITNTNNQTAVSGNVNVTGNNRVGNVGGSGNAANFNSTNNNVNIR